MECIVGNPKPYLIGETKCQMVEKALSLDLLV
jgi:hypothetical protein